MVKEKVAVPRVPDSMWIGGLGHCFLSVCGVGPCLPTDLIPGAGARRLGFLDILCFTNVSLEAQREGEKETSAPFGG